MKFFYALMLFLMSLFIFFWAYIFLIPSPKLYLSGDTVLNEGVNENNVVIRQALEIAKVENKGDYYFFDIRLNEKRPKAIMLYSLLTIILVLSLLLLLHSKTYIFFPLITSLICSLIFSSLLWIFTNSFSKNLYLDIQNIRNVQNHLSYLIFLGTYILIVILLMIFGFWYKFPEDK